MNKFEKLLERRDLKYKKYKKLESEMNKLRRSIQILENKLKSSRKIYDPDFEIYFPISVNFSGYED